MYPFTYDSLGNLIGSKIEHHTKNKWPEHSKTYKNYVSKNRLTEAYNKYEDGSVIGKFYEYEEVNNSLKRKICGYIQTKHGVKSFLKSLNTIT